MRKILVLFLMCTLLSLLALAQKKPQQRAEVKKPLRVEKLAVRPSFKWKKPAVVPSASTPKKNSIKTPSGMRAEKAIVSIARKTGKNSKAATPALFVYRPQKSSTGVKGIRTLAVCDTITLSRQSQIDSFPLLYPGCTTVKILTIEGRGASPAITRLDSLKQLTEITQDLNIFRTAIPNLSGINNITKIGSYFWLDSNYAMVSTNMFNLEQLGGFVFYNSPLMTNMNGLFDNLTSTSLWSVLFGYLGVADFTAFSRIQSVINFSVAGCPNITSLDGFQNLASADYGIQLFDNQQLSDISVLDQITQTSYLDIYTHPNLTSLNGLQNIIRISGIITLINNTGLTGLQELNSNLFIENSQKVDDTVRILYNPNLALCAVPFLCNYLTNGGAAEIIGNATGCSSIAEIVAACPGCPVADSVTWNGSVSNGWNDTLNWTPNSIPGTCTKVIIPSGTPNDPALYSNVSIGGLVMDGSTVYLEGFNLTVSKILYINNAAVYNGNSFKANKVMNPLVQYSYFDGTFECTDYSGKAEFISNTFSGDVTLSDSVGRNESSMAYFNVFQQNFTLINNSEYGQNYLSNASPYADNVIGKLTVINNAYADISVGLGGGASLVVAGDVEFKSDFGRIDLNNISFEGSSEQLFTKTGTNTDPLEASTVYLNKIGISNVILGQDFKINNFLHLNNNGGFIKTAPDKLLILNDGAGTTVFNTVLGSFINGPVKKIGNTAFTFPIGEVVNGKPWKAPISISAPSSVADAFIAQYSNKNPKIDGYDTALYAPGFGGISGREYWRLDRVNGSSTVSVMLSYDSARSGVAYELNKTQVASWNGSQWTSLSNGGTVGNIALGTVQSALPVTNYGPITFSFKPIRKPIITMLPIDTLACIGVSFKVRFSLDTAMVAGNFFQVQLSDTLGNFSASSPFIGGKFTTASDSFFVTLPGNVVVGKQYKLRLVGTLPPDTSINTVLVRVNTLPQQAFSIVGPNEVCIGSTVKYYPSVKENGVTYTLTLGSGGGTVTKTGDTSFVTFSNPSAGNILTMRTSNGCGNGNPIASITVLVKPAAPTIAPMITNVGRWITAPPAALAQNVTAIRWYKNNVLIAGANSYSYYASDGGNYKATYANDCGETPASNVINFIAAALPNTITFDPIPNKTYSDAPFVIPATSSSGLPVNVTLVSGPGNVTAGIYTITGTGTVTIRASQPGDNVYDTAAPVSRTFDVAKAPQIITFPTIADKEYGVAYFDLAGLSSSGLPVSYTVNSGPAFLSGNLLYITGLGTVSITASQSGNENYSAAIPITQTFCVKVSALTSITGAPYVCPGQTTVYQINQIPGLIYSWRIANGAGLPSTSNTAAVTWNTAGTYTLIVSATGPCGTPSANDSLVVNVVNAVTPGAVSNMLPANGITGQQLPLTLSWLPGANALTYDLYVWDSATTQPTTPFASNIAAVLYNLPASSLVYDKTYHWRVVSKNACLQSNGPVQRFRLRKIPDLVVTEVLAPTTANSGQTISISWKVKNIGPGNTNTNQHWTDAVFLSFDTIPNFDIPPNTSGAAWSQLDFPVRPLLVGTKPNVSALDSGQQYSNSINYTIPVNLGQPLYAYVISNYPASQNAPLQMLNSNDTARATNAINITVSPTPDLRVDTVFTSASTFSGSTLPVTYKVKNYGVLTPPNNVWQDKMYISPSPIFNSNNAIALKAPNGMNNYYPNVIDAVVGHQTQLKADSSYTKSIDVVIPNFISGSYFIHVFTNVNKTLYEGAAANNNINHNVIQVFLTPTPQLTINSLTVPFTTASITQPIGINWNVLNAGFNDNIEKNKGHYYVRSGFCSNGSLDLSYIDSIGFGGSYWGDKVYLSTDGSGLNINNAILLGSYASGTPFSGLNSPDVILPPLCVIAPPSALVNNNTSNVLRPSSNHPGSLTVALPSRLPQGNYYVYVYANQEKTVFEFPDTPSIRRSALPISVLRPDLVVTNVTVPATASGAQPISISYNIQNNGPGAVFNANRNDRIYVSTSPTFNASAVLIGTHSYNASLALNTPVPYATTYTFPAGTTGTRYIFVQTNSDSLFAENNYTNNVSTAATINVSAAAPADLLITQLQFPDSVFTQRNNFIKYRIENNGSVPVNDQWTDSIFISCQPVFNRAAIYFIAARKQDRTLAVGSHVTDSFNIDVPYFAFEYSTCFPKATTNQVYFYIKTNSENKIYEGANTANNVTGSGSKLLINSFADYIVTSIQAADTATVARKYRVNFTVKNIGYNPGKRYYGAWSDAVYFSADSIFNNNAKLATGFAGSSQLQTNASYSESLDAIAPNIPTGDYYVMLYTNNNDGLYGELDRSNNINLIRNASGSAKKIHVIQPLLPDLVDSIITAPSIAATGQPLTLIHRVTNKGAGVSYPNTWSNNVWISTDFIPFNSGDYLLSSKNKTAILQPGEFYDDTITAQIPIDFVQGNYVLISHADAGNVVFEPVDSNNIAYSFVSVYRPAPADLIVQQVTVPDSVFLGYALDTATWTISNISANNATGISADGIYLSKSGVLDSTAVLLGVKNKTLNMAPLSSENIQLQPMVNDVKEGSYKVMVKTDLLNNIIESDKTNNTGTAVGSLYVKVKPLVLNVTETNTLHTVQRYYKLRIPDSLRGSTIQVTLKTNDSLTMRNEMYIGAGYVPTAAKFDYRFETPNAGNQQIIISEVLDSNYYILVRSVSPNPLVQNISLKAVKLPFAILIVQSNAGGNGGNVTVKISGSLFTNNMVAKLSKSGTTITSSSVYFVNSTSVFATFPLQGKPLGIYDVSLTKQDASVTTLAGSFSVVSPNNGGLNTGGGVNTGPNNNGSEPGCDPGADGGLNSQLVTELVHPEKVFAGWPFTVQVNYNNPTNMDVPAQVRILYNDKNVPMAMSQNGLANAGTSLVLQLTEPGGPPGFIRAGGSGSAIIYAKAPLSTPGHTIVTFNLK